MAGRHAPLKCAIWDDEDWKLLGDSAQRAYLMLLSQSDMTHCGVIAHRPKRWANLAKNTTATGIRRAVSDLATAHFVVLDTDTEELLCRTYVRHSGVLGIPNVARAMVNAWRATQSPHLRDVVIAELARHYLATPEADREKGWAVVLQPRTAGGMAEDLEVRIGARADQL